VKPAKECHARLFNRSDIHSRDPRLQHHLLHFTSEIIPTLTMTAIQREENNQDNVTRTVILSSASSQMENDISS